MDRSRDVPLAIDVCGDLRQFFGEVVENVRRVERYDASSAAEMYVVALLADYAGSGSAGSETLTQPLAALLDGALQATGRERFERLRAIGDGVLYVSGFFSDYLENRGLQVEYYSSLGARAYDVAGRMLKPLRPSSPQDQPSDGIGTADVLVELAGKFRMFVSLIRDVSDALYAGLARSDQGTLQVYERWLRTGSSALGEALGDRGLVPQRGSGMVH
jgi:hypothetical protein